MLQTRSRADAVAEAGGVRLDLRDDRLGRVTRVSRRNVGVRVERVNVVDRAIRVSHVLRGQHEGPGGHVPSRDGRLGRRDLLERPADVHGAGALARFVGPWHSALDGDVEAPERGRDVQERGRRRAP